MKILVFDIGGTFIKYGCCTEEGMSEVLEIPTEAEKGGAHILECLIALIARESGYDAIGISTAGQVNAETGSIIYANSNLPNYTGMQLRKELEKRFQVPVMVENDVNAAAVGEAVYGAGKDWDSFLCLTYGTGIGGAIIEEKSVYHGAGFSAAEFGAIVTHSQEKIAGKDFFDGCYEKYASTTALVRKAMEYDPALCSGRKIFERLSDPKVTEILDEWIDELMMGLATLIHIFNPSCVVLGGGIMEQPFILEQVRKRIPKYVMPNFTNVHVTAAALGNQAGLLGINYLARKYAESHI